MIRRGALLLRGTAIPGCALGFHSLLRLTNELERARSFAIFAKDGLMRSNAIDPSRSTLGFAFPLGSRLSESVITVETEESLHVPNYWLTPLCGTGPPSSLIAHR